MTKKEKKELVEVLKKQLAEADTYFNETKGDGSAYCYGYLIGAVKEVIYQLEK
jgi:hypothetical protein